MQISNHYAAMPSMHFGYSCWVAAIVTQLLLAATQPSTAQKVCFGVACIYGQLQDARLSAGGAPSMHAWNPLEGCAVPALTSQTG